MTRMRSLLGAVGVAAGAVLAQGCQNAVDDIARYTGVGFDPEGVVHHVLWERKAGRSVQSFWRDPATGQTVDGDAGPRAPTRWRAVMHREDDKAGWYLERFWVRSAAEHGEPLETTWDFCLARSFPSFRLTGVWRSSDLPAAGCAASLQSATYRRPMPTEPSRNPAAAARALVRGRLVLGHDNAPVVACDQACVPTSGDRDCDLCLCALEKVPAATCDQRAGRTAGP